ncbi:hypothetical protein OCF62_11890 [Bacillus wiedmannii]|uniref:hypothetical protein n=1 Tax=Bacillus wiedmannii TaxID=1890302 RepID=UPI000BF71BD4|nr:hypothetical protein [Bacillus wiedmannii]MCU5515275.1 hypothetical protein [Bacillus wiedmannii]PEW70460.1 hypothetical protein CN424_25350 [Bacillus cereus]
MKELKHAETIGNIGMMVAHDEIIDSEDVAKVKVVIDAKESGDTGGSTIVNVDLSDVSIRDDRGINMLADQLVDKIDIRLRHKQQSMEQARGY